MNIDSLARRLAIRVFFETDRDSGIVHLSGIGRNLPFLVIGAWAVLMLYFGLSGSTPALLLGGLAGLMLLKMMWEGSR
jgi:hypothetical protein